MVFKFLYICWYRLIKYHKHRFSVKCTWSYSNTLFLIFRHIFISNHTFSSKYSLHNDFTVVEITSDLTIKESCTLFIKLFSLNLNLINNVKGYHCLVSLKTRHLHLSKPNKILRLQNYEATKSVRSYRHILFIITY